MIKLSADAVRLCLNVAAIQGVIVCQPGFENRRYWFASGELKVLDRLAGKMIREVGPDGLVKRVGLFEIKVEAGLSELVQVL